MGGTGGSPGLPFLECPCGFRAEGAHEQIQAAYGAHDCPRAGISWPQVAALAVILAVATVLSCAVAVGVLG